MKTLSVLVAVGVVAFIGAWALWGYHWDGYAPVLVRAQVLDASDGRPIPDAILITLHSEKLIEDRSELETAIARALQHGSGSLDDKIFFLLQDVHAGRVNAEGHVEVVAFTRTSGIGIGEWNVTKRFNRSRPARALVRAPGFGETLVEVRSFLTGPKRGADEIEHLVADLGSVRLTRE